MHQGVVLRDADGVIVDVNPAAEVILGRSRADLIGSQSVSVAGAVHPDGTPFPQSQSAPSVALATGRDTIGELVGLTLPDGELRWISVNARALREGGVITGVVRHSSTSPSSSSSSPPWPSRRDASACSRRTLAT